MTLRSYVPSRADVVQFDAQVVPESGLSDGPGPSEPGRGSGGGSALHAAPPAGEKSKATEAMPLPDATLTATRVVPASSAIASTADGIRKPMEGGWVAQVAGVNTDVEGENVLSFPTGSLAVTTYCRLVAPGR